MIKVQVFFKLEKWRKDNWMRHTSTSEHARSLALFPINDTLCPPANRAWKSGLWALWSPPAPAAEGGAIISISSGALALTLPDISVQCPTLLSCQRKKKKKQRWLFKGMSHFLWIPAPLCEEPEEEEEGSFLHFTPVQWINLLGAGWNITQINVTCKKHLV